MSAILNGASTTSTSNSTLNSSEEESETGVPHIDLGLHLYNTSDITDECNNRNETSGLKKPKSDRGDFNLLEYADLMGNDPNSCGICGDSEGRARLLNCLHVFCEPCLEKKLTGEGGDAPSPDAGITCPKCSIETTVGTRKVIALPVDFTRNVKNTSNSTDFQLSLQCTSCTAKETAVSRCTICRHHLCTTCGTIHQQLRCFETHRIEAIVDTNGLSMNDICSPPIKNGKQTVKCVVHTNTSATYYCDVCLSFICIDCLKKFHANHYCESVFEFELRSRRYITQLLDENSGKFTELTELSHDLEARLQDLDGERQTARDLINETYHSYKALLENCREQMLDKLNADYHERELRLLNDNDRCGKTMASMRDVHDYVKHFLAQASLAELVCTWRIIVDRLSQLKNTPVNGGAAASPTYHVHFETNSQLFEMAMKRYFGTVVTEHSDNTGRMILPASAPASALLTEVNGGGDGGDSTSPLSLFTTTASSMHSSFDGGDLLTVAANGLGSGGGGGVCTPAATTPNPIESTKAAIQLSAMAEYNLKQLANLENQQQHRQQQQVVSPTAGTTANRNAFDLADLLSNVTACKNLASLASLTSATENLLRRSTTLPTPFMNGFRNGGGGRESVIAQTESINNLVTATTATAAGAGAGAGTTTAAITSNATSISAVQQQSRMNKVTPMQVLTKFGQLGSCKGQFNSPHGFCLGSNEEIVVADTNNHRIQVFDKTGEFKLQFGSAGREEGQLYYPRKVAVILDSNKFVVCDRGNERSRMQIFSKNGNFLKKIAIRYIDIVAGLAVTNRGEIVAVDSVSPTVFVINEAGELLYWFDCSDFMREPSDILVSGDEFYVCDFKGHSVVVFTKGGQFLRRIGCESITNYPNGIDISDYGDIIIGDSHGNRFHVVVFSREGALISEFECPYVKVSRCCGLKITSEGYVVTLAKNNHHVLVLNTLYIL